MDAKTLKALKASIVKWERNAAVETKAHARIYGGDCPLCKLFVESDCAGCPVSEKTKKPNCSGSPWKKACDAYWDQDVNAFRRAAVKEVDFLKSLLPAEEPAP